MRRIMSLLSLVVLMASVAPAAFAEEPKHAYFTNSAGMKLHYMEMGKGTPVILIHGAGGSAQGNWFLNGIGQRLAKTNRVIAIDCRNHGRSDNAPAGATGSMATDVLELMKHLKIEKAHIGGYSMGGGVTLSLLASNPEVFISAIFGGSGIPEVDPEQIAKVPPDKQGGDAEEAEASRTMRERREPREAAVGNNAAGLRQRRAAAGRTATATGSQPAAAATTGQTAATQPAAATPRPARRRPQIDLTKITIPVLAFNGEFDRPNAKTHRMWRELRNFTNVVLPGKGHLTAIMHGYLPPQVTDSMVKFVTTNNPK